MTVRVLGKLLELRRANGGNCGERMVATAESEWWQLRRANGGRFEINQLLFADDTALEKENVKIFFIQKNFICYYNVYIRMVK